MRDLGKLRGDVLAAVRTAGPGGVSTWDLYERFDAELGEVTHTVAMLKADGLVDIPDWGPAKERVVAREQRW